MTLLQINKFFFDKGGSERYFFLLSEALEARGHRVVPFAMSDPRNASTPYAKYFVAHRDYEASGARAWRHARSFVRSGEAAAKLRVLIGEAKPDAAHLHNIYHQLTPSIIEELRRHRIPIVMTLHDYKLVCPTYSLFAHGRFCYRCRGGSFYHAAATACAGNRARSTLLAVEAYWQRATRVYDHVDRFLCPSRYLQQVMVEAGVGVDHIEHLPPFMENDAGTVAAEAPVDLPERFVLFAGRLSQEKGVDTLLDAAALRPALEFLIAGDGPQGATLRMRAEAEALKNVRFLGHLDRDRLAAVRRRASALVMPTLSPENAPFSVLEAAADGVPTIVSNMGGLPEMAEVIGAAVFRAGDTNDLVQKLDTVVQDTAGAGAGARAGRERALAYFSREKHVDRVVAIYNELTGRCA